MLLYCTMYSYAELYKSCLLFCENRIEHMAWNEHCFYFALQNKAPIGCCTFRHDNLATPHTDWLSWCHVTVVQYPANLFKHGRSENIGGINIFGRFLPVLHLINESQKIVRDFEGLVEQHHKWFMTIGTINNEETRDFKGIVRLWKRGFGGVV